MAEFIGVTVLVTLRDPPNAQIRGQVTNVVRQRLSLSPAVWIPSGACVDSFAVEGTNILELEIEPEHNIPRPSKPAGTTLIDPAIVSFHRPLKNDSTSEIPQSQRRPSPLTSPSPEASTQPPPTRLLVRPAIPIDTKPKEVTIQSPVAQDNVASTTLTGPFNELSLDREQESIIVRQDAAKINISHETSLLPDLHPIQAPTSNTGKRNRKGGARGKVVEDVEQQHPVTTAVSQNQNGPRRLKGWRQTNLTEDAPQSNPRPTHLAVHSLPRSEAPTRKRARRHRMRTSEDQNGWATGEATDIQDMGDFDFEGNLSKFDKQGVFDKIRQEDTTADEDRLVSFNRIPARPGTAGGKNLHYTENVLDSPHATGHVVWNSSDSEARVSSGRSSRRNISRVSVGKPRSRKGSTLQGNDHLAGSGLLSDPVARTRYSSHEQAGSPRLATNRPGPHYSRQNSRSGANLRIMPSDYPCPCLTPLQMVELEQLAVSELGLTEDIVTENASRGIAETVQRVITEKEDPRFKPRSDSPTVVILAGNNRSGARAIGAGRHLRNHCCQIVVCVLGLEREDDLLDTVRRQLKMYRNCGGQVTKADGLDKCLMRLHAPTELIIDALLGMHLSFNDLRKDDQATYFQLATWANKSKGSSTSVLAVDVPSGLDASSGLPTTTDDMELVIHADHVLSLGVPKAGLLTALGRSPAYEKWKLFVADIGISNMAWRKFGTRRRTDKLYITHSEWASEDAYSASAGSGTVKGDTSGASFKRLPFKFCAVSLQPFSHPVCTADGTIFDIINILPWLKKHGTNPVTGEPLKSSELIKLHFAKNDEGEMVDPVTFKVFTDNTHIIALGNTGNVYAYDTVERLNIKAKMWRDLVSDEEFSRKDIITLQDPRNVESRNLSSFKYLQDGVSTLTEEQKKERSDPSRNVNKAALGNAAEVLNTKEAKTLVQKVIPDVKKNRALSTTNLPPAAKSPKPSPSTHTSNALPYNAAQHTTGKAAASFTSTGLTPHTSSERALLSDEEYMLKPRRVKNKGYARIQTSLGDLNLELLPEFAPRAVWNFVSLAKKGYYKDVTFHRSIRNFMLQGGDPTGTGKGGSSIWGKNFKDELDGPQGHDVRGVVSMANKGKDTNGSQFFITYRAAKHLDRKHTIFGRVVGGMDTLTRIENVEVDEGDRPVLDVVIREVVVFVDPFDEARRERRENDEREVEREEVRRMGGREDDRTTWTGKRLRPDGNAGGDSGGGGDGVGKYLHRTKGSGVDEAGALAEEWEGAEEPVKKRAKTGAGFGNFDSW